jgi:hypothetical protein
MTIPPLCLRLPSEAHKPISPLDKIDPFKIDEDHTMKSLTLVCVVLLIGVSLAHVGIVEACSGSSYELGPFGRFLTQDYNNDIIGGQIYALSDSGINAVFQIDQVIQGDKVPEFLLFYQDRPNVIVHERGLGGCQYKFSPRLPAGRRFIGRLGQWEYGGVYGGTIFIENEDGLFVIDNPDKPAETLSFTYDEIIDFAAQRLNSTPHAPQKTDKPRPVLTLLTTESGDRYVVPVHQSTATKVTDTSGLGIGCGYSNPPLPTCLRAPNGIDTVTLTPIGTDPQRNSAPDYYNSQIEGTAGAFSESSELITVWAGQKLNVYATGVQPGITGSLYGLSDLSELNFNPDDPLIAGAGAWSPNGRTFAFSSQSGIWLWDALIPGSQPTLFQATPNQPILVRHFSSAGNYLALSMREHRYYVDLATKKEYPDGLFSPDDRILAVYDPSGDTLFTLYRVLPEMEPLWDSSYFPQVTSQFEWIDRNTYLYAACGEPMPQYRDFLPPAFMEPWCQVQKSYLNAYQEQEWIAGILFDYDPITHSLATLIDGDTITVNGETIELAGQTDSPIVAIELIPLIDMDYRNF